MFMQDLRSLGIDLAVQMAMIEVRVRMGLIHEKKHIYHQVWMAKGCRRRFSECSLSAPVSDLRGDSAECKGYGVRAVQGFSSLCRGAVLYVLRKADCSP